MLSTSLPPSVRPPSHCPSSCAAVVAGERTPRGSGSRWSSPPATVVSGIIATTYFTLGHEAQPVPVLDKLLLVAHRLLEDEHSIMFGRLVHHSVMIRANDTKWCHELRIYPELPHLMNVTHTSPTLFQGRTSWWLSTLL